VAPIGEGRQPHLAHAADKSQLPHAHDMRRASRPAILAQAAQQSPTKGTYGTDRTYGRVSRVIRSIRPIVTGMRLPSERSWCVHPLRALTATPRLEPKLGSFEFHVCAEAVLGLVDLIERIELEILAGLVKA
jgi:hypothetical protein